MRSWVVAMLLCVALVALEVGGTEGREEESGEGGGAMSGWEGAAPLDGEWPQAGEEKRKFFGFAPGKRKYFGFHKRKFFGFHG